MHKLSVVFVMLLCHSFLMAQWLPEGYELNGAVGMKELQDTVHFKKVYQDEHLLIKESKDAYYVGILSNSWTIGNAYYLDESQLKIMHVSAAAGETNYNLVDGQWSKDRPKWNWRHRDTQYWDELHDEPLQDLKAFYETFSWVGTTVSKGSHRELEFLLSKELIKDFERLRISFIKRTDNGSELIIGPGKDKKLAKDNDLNMKLHMGDLPDELVW